MRKRTLIFLTLLLVTQAIAQPADPASPDTIRAMVKRLDLEKYKATIKSLTRFGDRRQGTQRNRDAIDWIEAQLKSYGCSNTERLTYTVGAEPVAPASLIQSPINTDGAPPKPAPGGAVARGIGHTVGVNSDSSRQPDAKIRALDMPPAVPGEREEVYCTKIGAQHPNEMYLVTAHMDGIGWGEAANDNGSGTALVMELARIFSSPDMVTDRSIRFILWNNEETGLNGSQAYVTQRAALQGVESPAGSGKYPEPKWLGVIQHDMMLFDHGMPRADGSMSPVQRPEADVNIEFRAGTKFAAASQDLAWALQKANEGYTTHYPASVGPHMSSTDSVPFQDVAPSVSMRENERGAQIGAGWDPQWHQPTDLYKTYDDKDFMLGLNAAQTTLAGVATLAGATLK